MSLSSTTEPLSQLHDLAMLDLDGVVYIGPDPVPMASESLRTATGGGTAITYLTNNASRVPSTILQHLRELDMPISGVEAVVTSAQAVARLIAESVEPGATILVAGGEGLEECLRERGLRIVSTYEPMTSAAVQGFSPNLGWQSLAEVSYAVNAGVPWFASNTDLTFPTAQGIAPGNGSLVQAVANATGKWPVVAGKPEPALFSEALLRHRPTNPLMIGDRLDTDIVGARRLGITSLAVLTGVSSPQDLADAAPDDRPDFVGHDLGALLSVHPEVEATDTTARCAGSQVALTGSDIIIEFSADPLTDLRAALALAWRRRDRTGIATNMPTVDSWTVRSESE